MAEVSLGAVRHNVAEVLRRLPPGTEVFAVVKAGGYGHGAVPVAKAALDAGATRLAVATLDEAAPLRQLVAAERILVMGGLLRNEARSAAELGVAVNCSSSEMIDAFAAAAGGEQVPVHLKVDTGMGRFGCRPDEARHLAEAITRSRNLRLAGTWTHFASADTDAVMTQRQFDLFQRVLADIGVDPGLRHACNSAGALRYPAMALDAVRIGIAMYGCEGDGLQPVLRLRAPVAQVKKLQPGDTVGYGATWRAARASLLATVAIGYADGVLRSRANTGWALVRGRRAPLAGRVSMDAISVDVTDIPGVETGDLATLIGEDGGERITAEMVAGWSGSISYEVLTAIGPRVHREYVE